MSATFKDAETADMCVDNLNHRWFAKRRIIAQTWDGVTNYEVEETEAEREIRMKKWESFLGDSEEKINAPSEENISKVVGESELKKIDIITTDNSEHTPPAMDVSDQEKIQSEKEHITEEMKIEIEKEQT